MTFEKSNYFKTLTHFKLEKPFGNFYLCEHFFIAELNDGIHFNWKMIENVMKDVIEFYGKDKKFGYISNRVHSYSMNPHNWNKVNTTYGEFQASAIVYYNEIMHMNAALEKQISDKRIRSFRSLKEAIEWMLKLESSKQ